MVALFTAKPMGEIFASVTLSKQDSTTVSELESKQTEVNQLLERRIKTKKKITLAEMPEEKRYTKLKTESAFFMSTIKMICYSAETAIANMLHHVYGRNED